MFRLSSKSLSALTSLSGATTTDTSSPRRAHRQAKTSRFLPEKLMRTEHIHGSTTEKTSRPIKTFLPLSAMFFLRFQRSPTQSLPERTSRFLNTTRRPHRPEALLPLRVPRATAQPLFRFLNRSALTVIQSSLKASSIIMRAEALQRLPTAQAFSLKRFTRLLKANTRLPSLCSL